MVRISRTTSDVIKAGDGVTLIDGGADNDTIEVTGTSGGVARIVKGGDGEDTYRISSSNVTIKDSDGDGSVTFNGLVLIGGTSKDSTDEADEGVYIGKSGETYTISDDDLLVSYGGKTLKIDGWNNFELGIRLKDKDDNGGDGEGSGGEGSGGGFAGADTFASPLVLDLDGDGIELTNLDQSPTFFDIDEDGIKERTGWVSADDGLLALDRNNNSTIDDVGELFGYGRTVTQSNSSLVQDQLGITYESGFSELAALDSNNDGVIDQQDLDFGKLKIWQDHNQDGVSQENELISLSEANVAAISLNATKQSSVNNGNLITDVSTYTTSDGESRNVSDVWFKFDQLSTEVDHNGQYSAEIEALPELGNIGRLKNLRAAMSEDAELKGLVSQIKTLGVADFGKLDSLVDEVLMRWAGISSQQNPLSRGPYVDSRHLAVLEAVNDTEFEQHMVGANPRTDAGASLERQYDQLQKAVTVKLIAQSDIGDVLFPEIDFKSGVAITLETDTSSSMILQRLVDNQPANWAEKIAYYQAGIRILDRIYKSFSDVKAAADDGITYRSSVETLLQANGLDFQYDSLVRGYIGSDGDDVIIVNNSIYDRDGGPNLISTGAGNDEVRLYNEHQVLYWGEGQGNDVVDVSDFGYGFSSLVDGSIIVNFQDLSTSDVTFSREEGLQSKGVVITINSSGETLTLRGLLDFTNIADQAITFKFSDNNALKLADVSLDLGLAATSGNDVLVQGRVSALDGLAGDDILQGDPYKSSDYVFDRGYGNDQIIDLASGGTVNTVTFGSGITRDDLVFDRSEFDPRTLVIRIKNSDGSLTDDSLTIHDQFKQYNIAGAAPVISKFIFTNGDDDPIDSAELALLSREQTSGDDKVFGTADKDVFKDRSNAGEDQFDGLDGGDKYQFEYGHGIDHVKDTGRDGAVDKVVLTSAFEDYSFSLDDNGILSIAHKNGQDRIFVHQARTSIETYSFAMPEGDNVYRTFSAEDLLVIAEQSASNSNAISLTDTADNHTGTNNDDFVLGLGGDDTIAGGQGEDVLRGGAGVDTLNGDQGNDTLFGGEGADTLNGGVGDDVLYANDAQGTALSEATDTLNGGAGNDKLFGDNGDDQLFGGADDDRLEGGYGDDIYEGGSGDDVIVDTSGSSVFRYNIGDGDDIILSSGGTLRWGTGDTGDVIEFGAGISQSDLSYEFVQINASDYSDYFSFSDGQWALKISLQQGGSITLAVNSTEEIAAIKHIKFADQSTLTPDVIRAQLRQEGAGDQTIVGHGYSSNENFTGGAGDDVIAGNGGEDTYFFGLGDGNDRIIVDQHTPLDTPNTGIIRFEQGIDPSGITVSRSGDDYQDLVLTLSDGSSMIVEGNFSFKYGDYSEEPQEFDYIQSIVFKDSQGVETTWTLDDIRNKSKTQTAQDDLVIGTGLKDNFASSAGNDQYIGGHGSDSYHFGIGSGSDVVVETADDLYHYSVGSDTGAPSSFVTIRETDTLTFASGLTMDDLEFTATGSNLSDLKISIKNTADTIIIKNQLLPQGNWGRLNPDLVFGQYREEDLGPNNQITQQLWERIYSQMNGSDFLFAAGIEKFVFADDPDTIIDRSVLAAKVAGSIENSGDDTAQTDDAGGTLDGGAGNDSLNGGAGDDIYIYDDGFAEDLILDKGGNDRLKFGAGVSQANLSFTRAGENGQDLLIELAGAERNAVTIKGQFSGTGNEIEALEFSDGTVLSASDIEGLLLSQASNNSDNIINGFAANDTIHGYAGDDVIDGREGNDFIDGGQGRDVAIFHGDHANYRISSDGDVTIVEDLVGNGGTDRLSNIEELRFVSDDGSINHRQILVANTAPTAAQITTSGSEDSTVLLRVEDLLAQASDAEGDSLSVVSVSNAQNGNVELTEDGRILFTPNPDYSGAASFDYVIRDSAGLEATNQVTINISAINDAVLKNKDLSDQSFSDGGLVQFQLPDDAFVDVDNANLTYSAELRDGSPLPSWLSFDAATRTFSGTIPRFTNEYLSVVVTASDGATEAKANFALQVAAPNKAPVLGADSGFETASAQSLIIQASELLANDSDPEGDSFSITAVQSVVGGTVNLNADGTLTFTPASGFSGQASFNYSVQDEHGASSTATVTIQVSEPAINEVTGTNDGETLTGTAGKDHIKGLDGADFLLGGQGADILDGGDGWDAAAYWDADSAVTVNLGDVSQNAGEAAGDTYIDIEAVIGSSHNDTLTGDDDWNGLYGGDGDDVINGKGGNDNIEGGAGNDVFVISKDNDRDTIEDFVAGAGSDDVIRFEWGFINFDQVIAAASQDGSDVVIDIDDNNSLTLSNVTLADLHADDFEFPNANVVTEITGTNDGETLTGDRGLDHIKGLDGSDFLLGGQGGDILDGGDGWDAAAYWDADSAVTVNLGEVSQNTGEAAGDTYIDIEAVIGSSHNDTLTGDDDWNGLYGGDGDDVINGKGGNDNIQGGAGNDVFVISKDNDRDTIVDFVAGAGSDDVIRFEWGFINFDQVIAAASQNGSDVVIDIDDNNSLTLSNVTLADLHADDFEFPNASVVTEITGTNDGETLTGDRGLDHIKGLDGSDFLLGGQGGDILDGGDGWDAAAYWDADAAVTVNLGDISQNTGEAAGDTYIDIEAVIGSSYSDTLTGDDDWNGLYGGDGDDVINGKGGNDNIEGGNGDDTFIFATGDGEDTIEDFVAGAGSDDVIELSGIAGFGSFADVLAAASDQGSDTLITLDSDNSITLTNVSVSDLHQDDFRFA